MAQLEGTIRTFIDAHHAHPTPFVWTKTADEILASIGRSARRTLDVHGAPAALFSEPRGQQTSVSLAFGTLLRDA